MAEQVMCMDTSCTPGCAWIHNDAPVRGCVYSVRGDGVSNSGIPIYLLHEIRRPTKYPDGSEMGYGQWRFHPIHDSDIEQFREIARNPEKKLETA